MKNIKDIWTTAITAASFLAKLSHYKSHFIEVATSEACIALPHLNEQTGIWKQL